MPSPKVNFKPGVDLPFMVDFYPEGYDGERDVDHDEILSRMEASFPKAAAKLGVAQCDLDHSPGLTWRVEEHFYLVPLKGEAYDWVLVRLYWDDDAGRYDWSQEVVGSGFRTSKAAGRAMLKALFERCDFDLNDDDYAHYRDLLAGL